MKSRMPTDLETIFLTVDSAYKTQKSPGDFIAFMQFNTQEKQDLLNILAQWVSMVMRYSVQKGTKLYAGMAKQFYLRFRETAKGIGVNCGEEMLLEISHAPAVTNPNTNLILEEKGKRSEVKTDKGTLETKQTLSDGSSIPITKDGLSTLQINLLKQVKQNESDSTLEYDKTYELSQNDKGLLVLEKSSYLLVSDSLISTLTENIKKLEFLKSVPDCFTSAKSKKNGYHYFTITFSKEASQAIINSCRNMSNGYNYTRKP